MCWISCTSFLALWHFSDVNHHALFPKQAYVCGPCRKIYPSLDRAQFSKVIQVWALSTDSTTRDFQICVTFQFSRMKNWVQVHEGSTFKSSGLNDYANCIHSYSF